MSEVETLQFESGRVLQALYANDLNLLKGLEQEFGVHLTSREGWLRVEGEGEQDYFSLIIYSIPPCDLVGFVYHHPPSGNKISAKSLSTFALIP